MRNFIQTITVFSLLLISLNMNSQNRIQLEYEDESIIELSYFEDEVSMYVKLDVKLHNFNTSETYGDDPENLMRLTKTIVARESQNDDKVEIKFWISEDKTKTQITSIRL